MFKHGEIITGQFDNAYLNKVDENILRLQKIYDGQIDYISDDYALLIATFEKLYKGIHQELSKIYNDVPKHINDCYARGHRFSQYLDYIDSHIKLSSTEDGYDRIYQNCTEFENDYTNARYEFRTKEEFYSAYRKLEFAVHKMYSQLSEELQKNNLSLEDEEELKIWE